MGSKLLCRMVRIKFDCSCHHQQACLLSEENTLRAFEFEVNKARRKSRSAFKFSSFRSTIFNSLETNKRFSALKFNNGPATRSFTFCPASTSTTTMSAPEVREIKLPPSAQVSHSVDGDGDKDGVKRTTAELQTVVDACATCLLNGGVISVPTDTIYGIAGLSQKIDAVNRIYDIKQRNYQNPVAISVGDADDIYRWSKVTVPRELLTDLLPGPVTVVFDRSPELNPSLNPHTSKVGIRIPGNIFMQELARKCGTPIALTSANISGGRSCLQIEEFQHLWPQLDLVVNGGVLNDTEESRLGSTVVDLSETGTFRIIRNGSAHVQTVKVLQDKYDLKNVTSPPPQAPR